MQGFGSAPESAGRGGALLLGVADLGPDLLEFRDEVLEFFERFVVDGDFDLGDVAAFGARFVGVFLAAAFLVGRLLIGHVSGPVVYRGRF